VTDSRTPITLDAPRTPSPPDADWATIIERLMATLTATVPTAWSDHNPPDPGVTLAEAAAYAVADLHYRTAERAFASWPLEVRAFAPDVDRHWHVTLPVGEAAAIAGPLAADQPTSAARLEPLVRACREPSEAVALLGQTPWSGTWNSSQRPIVIALMRARLVRAIAQECADLVAAAVDAERGSPDQVATRDARAAQRLAVAVPLWPSELTALVRRERRRLTQEALVARLAQVRAAASASDVTLCRAALAEADLDGTVTAGRPSEIDVAMAAARMPVGALPEDLESADGVTQIWPPHPIQALTCEPVTAADYARRAREHADVGRAWAVPGRLTGIAWNGLPTGTSPDIVADPDAAAVTLVVERVSHKSTPIGTFLREVLRVAIGTECQTPFPPWQDSLDRNDPRRVICDEVGASLLRTAEIVVQGAVITGVGVDPATTLQGVRDRIAAFFAAGRGPVLPPGDPEVSGPWPLHDQPPGGWVPGDPIRFTEVIEAIVRDPAVLGVEQLAMQVSGNADFRHFADGSLPIPANAVPELAGFDCLAVRFVLAGDCSDA
jgi:hypothetical protein